MPPLNYEQLLSDYNDALNTQLRGFRPSEEYLDLWVPDCDHTKSILSLIEAAEMAGKDEVVLALGKTTMSALDLSKLRALAGAVCRSIDITPAANGDFHLHAQIGGTSAKATKREAVSSGGPSPYRLALSARLGSLELAHEGSSVKPADGRLAVSAKADGASLHFSVEKESAMVREARFDFTGAATPEQKALFELVCAESEGRPLQDAADHAVLRVEYSLRPRGTSAAGIVTPKNADPMFALPMKLLRDAYATFKKETGRKEGINFSNHPPGEKWEALSDDGKKETTLKFIAGFLRGKGFNGNELGVASLQGQSHTRVFCTEDGSLPRAQLPGLLMELEREFRHGLEGRLEVFLDERKDMNSKRRL